MTRSIVSPKTFLAYSLGCRTNQAEIEDISLQSIAHGLRQAKEKEKPDIVLLNTCVVTQKAEKETRQKIRELRKKYPKSFLVVLGCAVTAKEKFNINLPEADLIITNENKNQAPQLIHNQFNKNKVATPDKNACYSNRVCRDLSLNKYQLSGRKFIKIQDGCDQCCSYCITCHLRGKPTSIPSEKIIEEINFWVERGIKEIILTGINIGLYNYCQSSQSIGSQNITDGHTDRYDTCRKISHNSLATNNIDLVDRYHTCQVTSLLKRILFETKIEKLTFSSIYPEMLTDKFLKSVISNPRVSQYFHLSLQSGSPSVLERMNRETDLSRLLNRLKQIKIENKFFTFKADIITGFPNETEKEFQETLDFIKKTKIPFVHVFPFSARKGTLAYEKIKKKEWFDLSSQVKKFRVNKILETSKEVRNNEAKKMIDSLFHCFIVRKIDCHSERVERVEESLSSDLRRKGIPPLPSPAWSVGMTKDPLETYEGIIENGWPIKIKILREKDIKILGAKGKILPVKITGFEKDYLIGEIVSLPIN